MKAALRVVTILVILSMTLVACVTASSSSSQKVNLTFWWWAESDAPGADAWMAETVSAYEKLHPNVTIDIVPQSTDTLISAFQSAVTAKSGPDMASQWATGPVLGFVWQDAIVPISDYVPSTEISNWLNTNENMYQGKLWGMPMYLIGINVMYNKTLFARRASPRLTAGAGPGLSSWPPATSSRLPGSRPGSRATRTATAAPGGSRTSECSPWIPPMTCARP